MAGLLSSCACHGQESEDIAPWRIEDEDDMEPTDFGFINIRQASFDDLMQIPGMTEPIARLILENREIGIKHISPNELINFLQYKNVGEKDLEALASAFQGDEKYRFSSILRYQYIDPSGEAVEKSPYRLGEKVIVALADNFRIGVALEKDPGEELFWDHNAFSLKARLPADKGYCVLGDYTCKVGHGLIISTQRNFGIGGNVARSLIFDSRIIKDHISWSEKVALRGGAISLDYKGLEIDTWASQRCRDAHIDDDGNITSFSLSGLHRTESEMEGSDVCVENALGMRVGSQLFGNQVKLGITHSAIEWDRGVFHNNDLLTTSRVSGADIQLDLNEVSVSSEGAFDDRGNYGVMGTLQGKYDIFQQVFALYHIQPDYYAPLSSSLDFDYGRVGNREGVYSHSKLTLNRGSIQGFAHLFRYPRKIVGQGWGGRDFYLSGIKRLNREIMVGLSSRWIEEEDAYENENLRRWRGSTFVSYQFKKRGQIKARIRFCKVQKKSSLGRLFELGYSNSWNYSPNLYQEFHLKSGFYHADDYSQRLFWYESDISRSFRFRPLWDKGVMLQIEMRVRHSSLGCLEISMIWDQPAEDSSRHSSQTLKVVYRYN
ncbi:MAG: hypothetical protein JSV42_02945 [Chloroflexota bacterium]|nr:MAG: hypothetical protein JSV42_02945 [Chloroflexota bacterium]